MQRVSAAEFHDAYLRAYDTCREKYDDTKWAELWKMVPGWSHHMLWEERSVIRNTARALGFEVAKGEPMRLDAVFVPNKPNDVRDRFPAHVVLEHENAPGTFANEIRSLLSVRARLKVGITYSLIDHRRSGWNPIVWLQEQIRSEYQRMKEVVSESSETEYLFLVGEESIGSEFILRWRSMSFTAAQGPGEVTFAK